MRDRTRVPGLFLVLLLTATMAPAARASAQIPDLPKFALSVVAAPASLKPGGVAVLNVLGTRDLVSVEGDVAGRPVRFWPTESPIEWHGFIGISLETGPGEQTVVVNAKATDGAMATGKVRVVVERHRFATRRLRVAARMASPPAEEAARIAREAKAMADAFATITPHRLWRGAFDAPVPGAATSSFGRLTITNGKPAGRHQGADFRATTGTPVQAPNAGRVVIAENLYFAGNTVILDHGLGMYSLLAHLSRIDVQPGALVARGDVVGESGATGRVTGPHLHWAVRFGDFSIDPLALVAASARLRDDPPASSH